MNIEIQNGCLRIKDSLGIEDVRDVWNLILENITEINTVDLSELENEDVDLAGIQVLMMLASLKTELEFITPPVKDPRFALFSTK